jgi:drug/metabolite transporter (DMT)-like permease
VLANLKQSKFIVMALLSAIAMGTIGPFARFADLPAEHITFYRLFIGSLCLLTYMLATGKKSQIKHKISKRHISNGLMLAGFMFFYIQAMNYTTMATAIMMVYLAPLTAAIFAHFFFNERLGLESIFAIGLALLGFALMMELSITFAADSHEITGISRELTGIFYGLLSLVTYSAFILINRKPSTSTAYQSTLVQLSVGALCMLPLVITTPIMPTTTQLPWLIAIGLIPGFLGILFAVRALNHLAAVTYGTLAYIEPVAVIVLAWWLFEEHLTAIQLLGCLMIMSAGIYQGVVSQRKAR